jgi:hypothetical protein
VDLLLITNALVRAAALAEQLAQRAMSDTPFHTPAFASRCDPDIRTLAAASRRRWTAVLRPRPRWVGGHA